MSVHISYNNQNSRFCGDTEGASSDLFSILFVLFLFSYFSRCIINNFP